MIFFFEMKKNKIYVDLAINRIFVGTAGIKAMGGGEL